MSKLIKTIATGGLALILLINTIISAENCDVSLSRSKCGRVTRIESGKNYAVMQYNPDNTWKAYTMNNGQLTVADSSDTNPSYGKQFDSKSRDLSLEQNLKVLDGETPEGMSDQDASTQETTDTNNAELQKLLSSPLLGARFSSNSGRLNLESSNGNKWVVKSDNGQIFLYNEGDTLAMLNLNEPSKYSNILLQNGTLATFIDQQCQIETAPTQKLNYDQAAEIGNLKRQASQSNINNRPPPPHPFHPFGPPPPRPFQPFGPPPHLFQQQSSFYQPRQYLRMMPFGGFGQ